MKFEEKNDRIGQITILGVGLIGGSFGRALRETQAVDEIVGYGRNPTHLSRAKELGLVDRWSLVLEDAVADAEIVLVATPVGAMSELFEQLMAVVAADCIITDAGSVKMDVIKVARAAFDGTMSRFVPGHPISGREDSGVEAASGSLFRGHKVILTPVADTDQNALDRVAMLWRGIGAELMEMSPEQHDRLLALTSHLPHIVAYGLVNLLATQQKEESTCFDLAAGGFYDITRVASSDPEMWRDICLHNSDELLGRIAEFQDVVSRLAELIRKKDADGLQRTFQSARDARSRVGDRRRKSD